MLKCGNTLENICKKLLSFRSPLILMHTRPDADTVGSAMALSALLRQNGAEPVCVCPDAIPSRLEFLCEGECVSAFEDAREYDAVISVDVASPAQLGRLEGMADKVDVMIDHHGKGTVFAPEYYIDAASAACGEIVFEMARIMGTLASVTVDDKVASRLYAAISSDTGSFKYGNTTAKTLRIAAELLALGIDNADISRRLFDSKSKSVLTAERLAYEKMQWLSDGKITAAVLTNGDKARYGLCDSDLETAIDIVRMSEGSRVSFVIKEVGGQDGTYRVSMRSDGELDVAAICAAFGGGGHRAAAGCTVTAKDADIALGMILAEIKL